MKKFLLLPLIALCMTILAAVPVFAEESGDWVYELSDVGLTITAYNGSDKEVVIPGEIDGYKVSAIGRRAFADNHNMTSVVIPEGVSNIYAEAFCGCNALSRIEFNAKNCTVPEVWIYSDSKGAGIFSGAGSASSKGLEVVFGKGVAKVPDHLFETASVGEHGRDGHPYAYVTSVTFSEGVKEIGWGAFRNCQELESVTFGQNEQTIGGHAFSGCVAMKEISFGKALTSIGDYSFCGCTGLEKITWEENLETIGDSAFRECTSLTNLELVSPLTTIGPFAFMDCTALKSALLPETLTGLKREAFRGCIKLNHLTINSVNLTVPEIWIYGEDRGGGVFSGAGSASPNGLEVEFGKGVAKVADHLFDTASLDEHGKNGFPFAYVTSVTFSDGVKEIGAYSFRNCQSLEKITFGQNEQTIHSYAFWGCSALKELTFGNALTTIEEYAFCGSTGLEKIIWGGNLDSIGNYAFSGCTSLTKACFVNPLTSIQIGAFSDCKGIKEVLLPETLTSLGGEAFRGCINLNKVIIRSVNLKTPDVWIYSGDRGCGVFSGAGSASPTGLEIVFYTGVTRIPANIFDTASIGEHGRDGYPYAYITSVKCASTVSEVGDCAFRSCQSLESIHFYNKDVVFGEGVFTKCVSPSFHLEGPDGGTVETYAKDNSLTFKASDEIEKMPVIEEPETAGSQTDTGSSSGDSGSTPGSTDDTGDTTGADTAVTGSTGSSAGSEDQTGGADTETWTCPNGHAGNTGRFCPECGAEKP